MTSSQQNQLAGLSLIIGGVYAMIWGTGHVIPAVLLIVGMIVLDRQQLTGKLGRIGLILISGSLLLGAGLELLNYVLPTILGSLGLVVLFAIGLLLFAGMVIYGIATMRAGKFHGGELLIFGPLSALILGIWGAKLGALGFVVLGFYLLTAKVTPAEQNTVIGEVTGR